MSLYHYTTGAHIEKILEDGFLKLTPGKERLRMGERPLVWFSTDEEMPWSALKPMRRPGDESHFYPTADELHSYVGLYRFRLVNVSKVDVKGWRWIKRHCNPSEGLAEVAELNGENPLTWRATVKRVPIKYLELQKRDDNGEYHKIDLDQVRGVDVPVEVY